MKKHAIIPIFIPHGGCPHDCIFCNQRRITAREKSPSEAEVFQIIERNRSTMLSLSSEQIEVAFFGGSFTAIDVAKQEMYLDIAKRVLDRGDIGGIRLSTRPDYIDNEIVNRLKKYAVSLVELGVQSFDETVLKFSERGHDSLCISKSISMLKNANIKTGIQLMIGLPMDNKKTAIKSALETVKLRPDIVRLYPAVVMENTAMYDIYKKRNDIFMSEEDKLEATADMYKILKRAQIEIARVGLKATELMTKDIIGFHPAYHELVLSRIFKEKIEEKIQECTERNMNTERYSVYIHPKDMGYAVGHKGVNKKHFPNIKFIGREDMKRDTIELR